MQVDATQMLRGSGLRVTQQRLALIRALAEMPHAGADALITRARAEVDSLSVQAGYDVLAALSDAGLVRRIQPAGSPARFELRVGDNHHHVVCRECSAVGDIDCAVGTTPCLTPAGLAEVAPGFVVDEAEVTYWGLCSACSSRSS